MLIKKPSALRLVLTHACLWVHLQSVGAETLPGLPPETTVAEFLRQSPAYQAAQRGQEAERLVARQHQVGPYEWTGTAATSRRSQNAPTRERFQEYELGLERTVRLPGKVAVSTRAGETRVAQSEAMARKVWHDQARLLLERYATWLRERESARTWTQQVTLLRQQWSTTERRQQLGDAARIEQQQALAALTQAEAQRLATEGRLAAASAALATGLPAMPVTTGHLPPAPPPKADNPRTLVERQLHYSPDLALARQEHQVAEAQMRLDAAERRPDPTVGVRFTRERGGAEHTTALVLSVPFGGEYRDAGAQASAFRVSAAAAQLLDVERRMQTEADQRVRDLVSAFESWQRHAEAAQQLMGVADTLDKGYRLGEGNLNEVLSARRLANEQQLVAATGLADLWTARLRLQLESGLLLAHP